MDNRPKVGTGVIVIKDKKVLLGKRKNAHGEGAWSFPGGHLEFQETIEDCAIREVKEETGLEVKKVKVGPFTNDIFIKEGKHYLTVFLVADYEGGEVKITEPDRWEVWDWFEWEKLPQPLFVPVQNLLKQGFNPFK